MLQGSGAAHARAIVVCVDNSDAASRIVQVAHAMLPQPLVRVFDRVHAHEMVNAGVDFQTPAGDLRYLARPLPTGGLCVIVGDPGTGKSVIKQALVNHDPKGLITPVVNRTLHTYHSVLRILCDAFRIDADGRAVRCEKRLIEEARRINHAGKMLAPIIDVTDL